jgi:chitinase
MQRSDLSFPVSMLVRLLPLFMGILAPVSLQAQMLSQSSKAIIAYIFPKDKQLTASDVAVGKLTRINYAFANLRNGRIVEGFAHDADNLTLLNSLKRDNPSLEVVISVGGWTWSGNFSDMALTKQSRSIFIESAVKFVELYNLDGLDIDWEYPGMIGDGNHFRPEDITNYTLLLKELRKRFNKEEKKLGHHLVTSIATGASADFLAHTEMAKAQKYVDTVNLMTYDFYIPGEDKTTGNHAPLYTNPADPKQISADRSVHEYEMAGVPPRKIVLGVPFYGKSWAEVPDQNHGLFQQGKQSPSTYLPYSSFEGLMNNGYVRYWDSISKAPYLYNEQTHTFVSYEDPESLKGKCEYIVDRHLGGVMFWEYFGDPSLSLVDTIYSSLHEERQGKR